MTQKELPEHVSDFVSGLDEDDIATLRHVIRIFNAMSGWCRVTRWLFLTALGALIIISQGYDAARNLLGLKAGH